MDGRLKVTGAARFSADHPVESMVHAVVVDGTVGRGRITGIDVDAATAQPGVLAVISHVNAPRLPYRDNTGSHHPPGRRLRVFQDDRIHFFGQPVAVVVAATLESAQHAANLIEVAYDAERPSFDLDPAPANEPVTYARGTAERALASAAVRLDVTYRTSRNHHNPMEPPATIAAWDGDRLTVWDKTQWVGGTRAELAAVFGLPVDAVRVLSPFVGGGFGSALRCWPHVVIAALAARAVGRPVKLVLTRRQMYFGTGFRPAYRYRLRLGSDRDGRLSAAVHDIRGETSRYENFREGILAVGQMLYSMPHVSQEYRTVPLDVNTPVWMRGPGYSTASFVIESAMDELADRIGVDPVELRHRNEPTHDESTGLPFSTRRLRECLRRGGARVRLAEPAAGAALATRRGLADRHRHGRRRLRRVTGRRAGPCPPRRRRQRRGRGGHQRHGSRNLHLDDAGRRRRPGAGHGQGAVPAR